MLSLVPSPASVYTSVWLSMPSAIPVSSVGSPSQPVSPGRYTGICCLRSGSVTHLHMQNRPCSLRKDRVVVAVCICLQSGCQHTSALCILEGRLTKPSRVFDTETVGIEAMALTISLWHFCSFLPGVMAESQRADEGNAFCPFMAPGYQGVRCLSRQTLAP